MTTLKALSFVWFSTIIAACSVPVDSTGESVSASVADVTGTGQCDANTNTCWKYVNRVQVYGTCAGGVCCYGCINARGVCVDGNTADACGVRGNSCSTCNTENECTYGTCDGSGVCHYGNHDETFACNRGTGRCDASNGTCCDGVFLSVFDPDTVSDKFICAPACTACTCKNPTTHVCEASPDFVNCSCP